MLLLFKALTAAFLLLAEQIPPEQFDSGTSREKLIDALARSIISSRESMDYFVELGPDVVPIVTRKLNASLLEGASPEAMGHNTILLMPAADQVRTRYQAALCQMEALAIGEMKLSPQFREMAKDSLLRALASPYNYVRNTALYGSARVLGKEAIPQILLVLKDTDESNRAIAANLLAKVGNEETATQIERILEQRRRGLTKEQIDADWSFRNGDEAVRKLRANEQTIAASTVPRADIQPIPDAADLTPNTVIAENNRAPFDGRSWFWLALGIGSAVGLALLLLLLAFRRRCRR